MKQRRVNSASYFGRAFSKSLTDYFREIRGVFTVMHANPVHLYNLPTAQHSVAYTGHVKSHQKINL